MLKRSIVILALALAPAQVAASPESVRERIIAVLRDDGYLEIRINRTLLGRMRFYAIRPGAEREIVVNPNTGVILRDYIRFLEDDDDDDYSDDTSADSSDDDRYDDDDESDDESDDDERDDDESDDDESDSSNSGSGSDDDESDNSGSGSSSSGSSSDDD